MPWKPCQKDLPTLLNLARRPLMPENPTPSQPGASAVIACGGTGGHLFPGLAVAEELRRRGCRVTLMVSPKDVDQQAIASISGMGVVTLPAVGLNRGGRISFFS